MNFSTRCKESHGNFAAIFSSENLPSTFSIIRFPLYDSILDEDFKISDFGFYLRINGTFCAFLF